MAGLGLTNALHEYQQGVAWNDQQKQQAVQNKQLATIQQANQAGADALTAAHDQDIAQQQKAWTDAGNDPATFQPKPFQPTPQVLLAGLHARSDALAKSGDMDLWTHNEAATAPIRQQIRQQVISKALADYQATGDGAALAQTVYPTVHDGVDITGITSGVDASQTGQTAANNGQPPAKVYNISTSDGQTHTLTGDQIASMAHDVMMNEPKRRPRASRTAKPKTSRASTTCRASASKARTASRSAKATTRRPSRPRGCAPTPPSTPPTTATTPRACGWEPARMAPRRCRRPSPTPTATWSTSSRTAAWLAPRSTVRLCDRRTMRSASTAWCARLGKTLAT
jgi:hypothetical protein